MYRQRDFPPYIDEINELWYRCTSYHNQKQSQTQFPIRTKPNISLRPLTKAPHHPSLKLQPHPDRFPIHKNTKCMHTLELSNVFH